jgi:hypothetical protein
MAARYPTVTIAEVFGDEMIQAEVVGIHTRKFVSQGPSSGTSDRAPIFRAWIPAASEMVASCISRTPSAIWRNWTRQ